MSITAPMFEYERDAVRVKACYVAPSGKEVHKKFSVDPNLTSYDTLRSLLSRAFELNSHFRLAYLCSGDWLPLLSDWDLDAAVLCASEPSLRLVLTDESRLLTSTSTATTTMDSMGRFETSASATPTSPTVSASEMADLEKTITNLLPSQDTITNLVASSNRVGASFLRKHVNQTLPAMTKYIHKAFSTAGENQQQQQQPSRPVTSPASSLLSPLSPQAPLPPPVVPSAQFQSTSGERSTRLPLSDQTFRSFMNNVGEVIRARELRLAVYHGGVEPALRKVVWKHILGVYPSQLNGRERMDYMRQKSMEYESLKESWINLSTQGQVPDKVKIVTNMIRKDVLRTDRQHKYFANDGNENVTILFNILTTYALNHPSVSYCQGMSDLLSPLLVTMNDESHAYLCFCALMQRLRKNFLADGIAMTKKFLHLSEGLLYYDPEFFAYLKRHQADDLLFCYRWLLLEMKREFAFEDALRVMETLWASLPPNPPTGEQGLPLFEEKFVADAIVRSTKLEAALTPKRPADMTFSKMVSLRRRTSSLGLMMSPQKRLQRFLSRHGSSENSAASPTTASAAEKERIRSTGSADLGRKDEKPVAAVARSSLVKSHSHLLVTKRNSAPLSNPTNPLVTSSNTAGSAPPSALASSTENTSATKSPKRLITNLKDFSRLAKSGSSEDHSEEPSVNLESSTDDFEDDEDDDDEVKEVDDDIFGGGDGDLIGYVNGNGNGNSSGATMTCEKLPEPTEFGDGNPFLMFLCLACLLQHRDHIMKEQFDYQEIAMYFDRMVRKHDVEKTLCQARKLFAEYLNDDWSSEKPNC